MIEAIINNMMISIKDNFITGAGELISSLSVIFVIILLIGLFTQGKFFEKNKF